MRAPALARLILVALAASPAEAQSGSMTGRVRGPGGVPLRGAQVLIDDTVRAVSDDSGRFVVAPVAKGVHRIMVRAIGFGPQQNLFRVNMGERIEREFTLQVNADTLATVMIVGDRGERLPMRLQGFEERRVMGQGHYINRAMIEKQRDQPMSTVLRAMPGMVVQRTNVAAFAINTRNHCPVNIYLDGNPIRGSFDINSIGPNVVHGVEYYAGGAAIPVAYHRSGDERCGVMLIWTK